MPFVVMIAGPNGSGKTTLIRKIRNGGVDLGEYINADDIATNLKGSYEDRVREAQQIADKRRESCLENGISFTFETVMSHSSKVDFFRRATAAGFVSVLYFVSTGDPALNVLRVAQRVALGGHDVPIDKITERYHRTMALFPAALAIADRAFVFQNSDYNGLMLGLTKETYLTSDGLWKASYDLADDAPGWIGAVFDALPASGSVIK